MGASLSVVAPKDAKALGIFPRGYPGDGRGQSHNCLVRGTLVQTADGEIPVEQLTRGTLVMTTNGAMPVKWIGRKSIQRSAAVSWHRSVLPIRVSRCAIDDETPRRDLYLSQFHNLFIDEVLIPAKDLVNGSSITFDGDRNIAEMIEYFSIEFDTHEVMFAEGTAVESFQYAGGEIAWDDLDDYEKIYGKHPLMRACAPICSYNGGRAELRGLMQLVASRFVDLRDPVQVAYGRIAARASAMAA
jgi:hypothetical protein